MFMTVAQHSPLTSRNSRLYSEKAYVLSRNFIRRALDIPIGSFEQEVEWLYYADRRLEKVVKAARALIQKSFKEDVTSAAPSEAAVPVLSEGGVIMLERTVKKLEGILEKRGAEGV
jgi:ubiquitin-conjugating enzyme E2 O